jgi:hypothetical protein
VQDADAAVRQAPEGVIALDPASAQADVEGTVLAIEAARKAGLIGEPSSWNRTITAASDRVEIRTRQQHCCRRPQPGIRENA